MKTYGNIDLSDRVQVYWNKRIRKCLEKIWKIKWIVQMIGHFRRHGRKRLGIGEALKGMRIRKI